MKAAGIQAKTAKKIRVLTTDSNHPHPVAPNVVDRNFTPVKRNQTWTADITYIPTNEGWLADRGTRIRIGICADRLARSSGQRHLESHSATAYRFARVNGFDWPEHVVDRLFFRIESRQHMGNGRLNRRRFDSTASGTALRDTLHVYWVGLEPTSHRSTGLLVSRRIGRILSRQSFL
jgi:transposase InsO family protein